MIRDLDQGGVFLDHCGACLGEHAGGAFRGFLDGLHEIDSGPSEVRLLSGILQQNFNGQDLEFFKCGLGKNRPKLGQQLGPCRTSVSSEFLDPIDDLEGIVRAIRDAVLRKKTPFLDQSGSNQFDGLFETVDAVFRPLHGVFPLAPGFCDRSHCRSIDHDAFDDLKVACRLSGVHRAKTGTHLLAKCLRPGEIVVDVVFDERCHDRRVQFIEIEFSCHAGRVTFQKLRSRQGFEVAWIGNAQSCETHRAGTHRSGGPRPLGFLAPLIVFFVIAFHIGKCLFPDLLAVRFGHLAGLDRFGQLLIELTEECTVFLPRLWCLLTRVHGRTRRDVAGKHDRFDHAFVDHTGRDRRPE